MKANAQRIGNDGYKHTVSVRKHDLTVDEPESTGGGDEGPNPQEMLAVSPASRTAITIGMYAKRKGWGIGDPDGDAGHQPAPRGPPAKFKMVVHLPKELPDEQRERLMQIAAKCPVHRTLEGEVMFDESVELS